MMRRWMTAGLLTAAVLLTTGMAQAQGSRDRDGDCYRVAVGGLFCADLYVSAARGRAGDRRDLLGLRSRLCGWIRLCLAVAAGDERKDVGGD